MQGVVLAAVVQRVRLALVVRALKKAEQTRKVALAAMPTTARLRVPRIPLEQVMSKAVRAVPVVTPVLMVTLAAHRAAVVVAAVTGGLREGQVLAAKSAIPTRSAARRRTRQRAHFRAAVRL